MKKYVIRTIKTVSLILALVLTVALLQEYLLCRYDEEQARVDTVYMEKKNTIDVVFLGASDVYNAFSPALAYEQQGFTSLNVAISSNSGAMYLCELKETLKNQNPKLIFVEVEGFVHEGSGLTSDASIRKFTDSMPLSADKVRTIIDLDTPEDKLTYLFPIIKYHSCWKTISASFSGLNDRLYFEKKGYRILKNTVTMSFSKQVQDVVDVSGDDTSYPLSQEVASYLGEFIDYCKDNSLNVVFLRLPRRIHDEGSGSDAYNSYCRANTIQKIVEENGFVFLNFDKENVTGVDLVNDYYNYEHMNVDGQQKFTTYFAKRIADEYGIQPTVLPDDARSEWNESVKYYKAYVEYSKRFTSLEETYDDMKETKKLAQELDKIIESGI